MVGGLLNPDEMNALMSAIQDGRVETESGSGKSNAVNYDLTSQDRVVHRQMPTLDAINEQIATVFGMGIAGRTRLSVRVTAGPASILRYGDLSSMLAPPATVTVVALGKSGAQSLLVLEPGLADTLIAAALGDKKGKTSDAPQGAAAAAANKPDAKRDMTTVERNVLKRLLSIFTEAMQGAWAPVLPFKPEVVRFETDPRLATSSPTSESAVLCSFELEGALRGVIQLALPYTAIEPAKKALMSAPKVGKAGDEGFATALQDELSRVEVKLVGVLGKTRMTVRQLLELEPGNVVMTGTSEGASLPLFVQGKPKFTGQPKVVGGAVALELDSGPVNEVRRPFELEPSPEPSSKAA